MTKKKGVARSPEYLDYIRQKPCCVCQISPAVPHHTARGGTGLKGSDFSCVPLCVAHHGLVHSMGRHTFQATHGVCFEDIVAQCQAKRLEPL